MPPNEPSSATAARDPASGNTPSSSTPVSRARPAGPALVHRGVGRTLVGMAVPMLAGTFAMNAYSITDTWFVSQLGTRPLAAMSFTFPVVMMISCVAGGLGNGLTMLVSHALGRGDRTTAARLTTHGLLLMVAVTLTLAGLGMVFIGPIFRQLGVDDATLPLVEQYMNIWFAGALTMSLPHVGNGILISLGDSRAASRLMVLGTVLNAILDPIMIFGLLGFPRLEMRGAALATVISQATSAVWLLTLLARKHGLLRRPGGIVRDCLPSWRRIAAMGSPSILSMMLMPLSASVITRLLGGFGHEAVAAAGAAGRIEMFAFVIPMALGMSLTPFMSQNFGAHRLDRIREALRLAVTFALLYGALMTALFVTLAPWIASWFTQDPKVAEIFVTYTRIIAFGYGALEVQRYGSFTLNGLHKPLSSTAISVIRVLVVLIPLSTLGVHVAGIRGLFAARLITDLSCGTLSILWAWRAVRRVTAALALSGSSGSTPRT